MELKFSEAVVEEFSFLQLDYGFKIYSIGNGYDEFSVVYVNSTTKVLVESISHGFNTRVAIGSTLEKLENYDLGDLLSLVSPESKMSESDRQSGQAQRLNILASLLQRFGSDILNGNFEIFPRLKEIVMARRENYLKSHI